MSRSCCVHGVLAPCDCSDGGPVSLPADAAEGWPEGNGVLEKMHEPRVIGGHTFNVPVLNDPVTGQRFLTPDVARLLFEVVQAFGGGALPAPSHRFALELGQGVIVPAGRLRLTSFSEREGAAAFEFIVDPPPADAQAPDDQTNPGDEIVDRHRLGLL